MTRSSEVLVSTSNVAGPLSNGSTVCKSQRLRYLVGFLAIRVVRSGGQSLNKHMGGCAEKHDVVELRIELHLISRRPANEQHVGVVGRQHLLDAVIAPQPFWACA